MNHPRAFVITLKRAASRFDFEHKHLESVGVVAEPFYGLDCMITGLETTHKYEVDNPGYKMGPKQVSMQLSHYMLWKMMAYQPDESFWVLEDDAQFASDWKMHYDEACSALPAQWDLVWLGSCCCSDKPTQHVAKNLFTVQWPMCTHAYQVRKKALPVILEGMEKIWAPLDIAFNYDVMPKLNTYTILPRLAAQWNTTIAP